MEREVSAPYANSPGLLHRVDVVIINLFRHFFPLESLDDFRGKKRCAGFFRSLIYQFCVSLGPLKGATYFVVWTTINPFVGLDQDVNATAAVA